MAANDYYNSGPRTGGQQQYFNNPLPPLPQEHGWQPNPHPSTSPFEAPFDDHVYPMKSNAQGSQNSLGQDSAYYGQGGGGRIQDSNPSFNDSIPLQTHPGRMPKDSDVTDHVYDIGEPGTPAHLLNERKNKKGGKGLFKRSKGRLPWVTYLLTCIQIAVFIAEIAENGEHTPESSPRQCSHVYIAIKTGSPIEIHPSFNPMIGPSTYMLINMGARFVPCMHNVDGVQNADEVINWPCPNTTTSDSTAASNQCTLQELCGFNSTYPVPNPHVGGSVKDSPAPNQWFRFIIPIFMHAGLIHIGFNMLLQCTLGREMEIAIGPIRYFLVYISSGIFGFVMGGNFAATGIASTGASGSLFGIIALNLLDLLYTWKERAGPWRDLAFIALDVVISFVLGLLPGLDNFSHIGGFLMGLVLGVCILHSPVALRQRISEDPPYAPVSQYKSSNGGRPNTGMTGFIKNPIGFFKGRKPLWWAWWIIRAVALVGVIVVFILLLNNFYVYRKTCSWCKYLTCLVSLPIFPQLRASTDLRHSLLTIGARLETSI
jgi:membrane associated rhomboid family serine protease